jgi:hypothetical protein
MFGTTTFAAALPIALVAGGLAYPWGKGSDALQMVSGVSIGAGVVLGAAVMGAPFFVVKKVAWDGPQALVQVLLYPPPPAGEWRRRPS